MWDTDVLLSLTYYWRGESRPPVTSTACFSVCFPGECLGPLLNMGDTVRQYSHSLPDASVTLTKAGATLECPDGLTGTPP